MLLATTASEGCGNRCTQKSLLMPSLHIRLLGKFDLICASAADGNTVRGYLNEQWTPKIIRALQRDCNHALASQLALWLRDHLKEVALDLRRTVLWQRRQPK